MLDADRSSADPRSGRVPCMLAAGGGSDMTWRSVAALGIGGPSFVILAGCGESGPEGEACFLGEGTNGAGEECAEYEEGTGSLIVTAQRPDGTDGSGGVLTRDGAG